MRFNLPKKNQQTFFELLKERGYDRDQFTMKFFPYTIVPAARTRLSYVKKFIDYSMLPKSARILDAGGGSGWLSLWLKNNSQRAFEIIYVDLSTESVDEANMLFRFFNTKIEIIRSDVSRLPFTSHSFQAVLASSVLEHMSDVDLALREIRRVLKFNGFLIVFLPNKFGSYSVVNDYFLPFILKGEERRIESHHEHLHGFTWWKNKFECHGFSVIETHNVEFLTTYFVKAARLFGLSRKYLYPLTFLDDKVARYLPKSIASDWMFGLTKR